MLKDIIVEKIRKEGAITFRDYMEMALYYPEQGYYTGSKEKIGRRGDFYTSPSFSPVFGQLIAKQIEEMWDKLEEDEFTIVEYGAGPGFLCRDILSHFEKQERKKKLSYCIIEKSPAMIEIAKKNVPPEVTWHSSMKEIRQVTGCVISNELVDNFSVHRVIMEDELKEVWVEYKNDLGEVLVPASQKLNEHLEELKISLPKDFCAEINLQSNEWMNEISASLQKGFVITIDYGYPSAELFYEHRRKGTLTCFHQHKANKNPYINIGEQDITAHVNFSALCLAGFKSGLEFCGYTDQRNFLLALGFCKHLKDTEETGKDYLNYKREKTLTETLIADMGSKFKVLIQQKGIADKELIGLRLPVSNR